MDKNEQAMQALADGIIAYVNRKIENAPYDKTFRARVIAINANSTYDILLNGKKYENISSRGGNCSENEIVTVVVPLNNYNKLYIDKTADTGGGGGERTVKTLDYEYLPELLISKIEDLEARIVELENN